MTDRAGILPNPYDRMMVRRRLPLRCHSRAASPGPWPTRRRGKWGVPCLRLRKPVPVRQGAWLRQHSHGTRQGLSVHFPRSGKGSQTRCFACGVPSPFAPRSSWTPACTARPPAATKTGRAERNEVHNHLSLTPFLVFFRFFRQMLLVKKTRCCGFAVQRSLRPQPKMLAGKTRCCGFAVRG
jgi:hypothetical protein